MKIEQINTNKLTAYANNSRTHSAAQINQVAASITEFGFTNPVLIDNSNEIIAGHGRVLAAKQLNIESIPCIRLGHLTPEQKRAYVIADNKIAENSGWDENLLAIELEYLSSEGLAELTGFAATEIADLLELTPDTLGETDQDAIPPLPTDPITTIGNKWRLGRHLLLCGCSTSTEDMNNLMGGGDGRYGFHRPTLFNGFSRQRRRRWQKSPQHKTRCNTE